MSSLYDRIQQLIKRSSTKEIDEYLTKSDLCSKGLLNQYNIEKNNSVKDINRKLWACYSIYALKELQNIKRNSEHVDDKVRAARSLSRWYYDKEQYKKAYEELEYINKIKPLKHPGLNRIIPEIKLLKKLGNINGAKRKLWDAIDDMGLIPVLCLGMAHISERELERLSWYNLIYDKKGYQQIEKIDETKPITLENIFTPKITIDKELEKYKVSVIVPSYNASSTIRIALNSLINQTVQNLEIIVVDDGSTDNTTEIVEEYAKKDKRIKLIKKEKNEGAYRARNTALEYVSGDFITVHDSDDWSHSQKIELQLRELLKDPKHMGSISYLVRATNDLIPLNPTFLLNPKFIMMNSSSLLVRKSVFEKLGGWDNVRVAADTELIDRIKKAFGEDSIVLVEPEIPLSIALTNDGSLTTSKLTNIKTVRFGLRRTYEDAFRWWHEHVNSDDDLYLDPKQENRPFPCPVPNRIQKDIDRNYDAILIADFSKKPWIDICISLMEKLVAKNKRVGIFHWPHYEGDPARTVDAYIFDFILKNSIDILVPDEELNTEKIFILTPKILDYALDKAPKVMYKRAYVVDEQDIIQEQRLIRNRNLEKTLNISAEWLPLEELQAIISE